VSLQPLTALGRLVKRKLAIRPAFHETDMAGVIHNSVYFLWFEQGRLEIMQEILPMPEALRLGIFTPVVENHCEYRRPARFGQSLLLITTHRVQPSYEGRLEFSHYLIQDRQRAALATGRTSITLVEAKSHRLIKNWDPEVWQRYQSLP
jgi:acyl-CoA thioester hydrolase